MKKLLNPIEFFNDKKLLIVNFIIFIVGTAIAAYMRGWFDHTFHLSFRSDINFYKTFIESAVCVLLLSIFIFIAGKIINKKTRFIDSLNLTFYIRIPFYLFALTNYDGKYSIMNSQIAEGNITVKLPSTSLDFIILIITSLLSIVILILQFITIYKGFKTLSNAKKVTDYLILAVLLILSMVISSLILKNI